MNIRRQFVSVAATTGLFLGIALTSTAQTVPVTDGLTVETNPKVTGTYDFAHGFGLIYGPMVVARQLGIVEKMFPNAKIEWQNIFTTAQQRDAMLADRLDFGSCTPGPFLQSWAKGVQWKWLQTTSGFDAYLMVRKDGPNSVLDFIGTSRKLSPGPNTAQYYTVQEMLRRAGKDVHALDRNWVNLPHPSAMQALIAGQLDGHFATADFALREVAMGMKKIASFKDVYGSLYAVGVCALDKTIKEHPDVARGYAAALRSVVAWMKTHPKESADLLSKSTDGKESAADFEKYLTSPVYDSYTTDANLKTHAASMHSLGVLGHVPEGPQDVYAYPAEAGSKW